MKIGIVGASSAGLFAAIFIKKSHPDFAVTLFEKNEKIGRKLLATGNGHCNILNMSASGDSYFQKDFMAGLFAKHSVRDVADVLESLGIPLLYHGDSAYPLSFSAESLVERLKTLCLNMNIEVKTGTRVLDFKGDGSKALIADKGRFLFDELVFATGGKSQENLGSDGSLFEVFKKHKRLVTELKPGLCPIKTKEKTKEISGCRHEAKVTLVSQGRIVYEEIGEVIFKDDGLSGIVIFNCESFIVHHGLFDCHIYLDLFPTYEEKILNSILSISADADSILPVKLANYMEKRCVDKENLAAFLKHVPFELAGIYDFKQSQVTIGGLSLEGITSSFSYGDDAHVHYIGEILDVDGPCGGYNLTYCLLSALILAESF